MSNGDFVKQFILEHPIISWLLAGSVIGVVKTAVKKEAPTVNVYNNTSTGEVTMTDPEVVEETE